MTTLRPLLAWHGIKRTTVVLLTVLDCCFVLHLFKHTDKFTPSPTQFGTCEQKHTSEIAVGLD